MTPPDAVLADPGRDHRALVEDVTVLLLARPDAHDLPALLDALDALAAQSRLPQRVVVAGLDPEHADAEPVRRHPVATEHRVPVLLRGPIGPMPPAASGPDDTEEPLTGHPADADEAPADGVAQGENAAAPTPRGQLVELTRSTLPVDEGHWIWFLAHDSRPQPDALRALAAAARRSSRVGVVGPKVVQDDQPRLLRALGHRLTPAGRATDLGASALIDQGQLDLRQDVLGVPLVGALVSSAVLDASGGIDPAFGDDGVDGLDVSWRSHLVGHRVVMAPDAVLGQGEAGLGVTDPRRTRLRRRQLALARGPAWVAPWRALGVAVTSALAAFLLLLVKRPADARDEWVDVGAVLRPTRGWGARRRFRGRRTVRPRDLAGLHEPRGSGRRMVLDTVGEALDPRAGRRGDRGTQKREALESGPVSEEFAELDGEGVRRGRWSWPLALAVLAALALTAWAWRDLFPALRPAGLGLTAAELGPATTDAAGLWSSALDGWRGGGLGHDRPAEPWLLPLALLTWVFERLTGVRDTSTAPTLAWLLVLAVPVSVVTAYLALRRATRRRWARAGLALGWAGLAPLTLAAADGRLGPVVVHVLAPLAVAGLLVCAARAGGTRRAAAAFATVLAVALSAAWVPLVLVPSTVGGLLLLVTGRGAARWRGAVLALLPWLLLLPWLPALRNGPLRLAGGAGATTVVTELPVATPPWQLLLLHPGGPLEIGSLEALPLWLGAALWLAALGALLLHGGPGRRAGILMASALLCLGLVLLLARTGLGALPAGNPDAGLLVTAWPGTVLSYTGAALLLAAGLLVDRLMRFGRAALTTVGAAAVVLPVAALAVLPALPGLAVPRSLQPGADPLPAVASEQARGPAALRTLIMEPTAGQASSATPPAGLLIDLVGAEPEPGRILRDRAAELDTAVSLPGPLTAVVEQILAGGPAGDSARQVRELGVGYLLLRAGEDDPAAARIDQVDGLTRVSSPPGQVLWRMVDDPGRVHLLDASGQVLQRVDVTGPHATTGVRLTDVPEGAVLAVSEGAGWSDHATVRVDGDPLRWPGGTTVEVPPGGYDLGIELGTPQLPWHLVALVLAGITAFLALPFGRAEPDAEERE